jgi:hypothetical protein
MIHYLNTRPRRSTMSLFAAVVVTGAIFTAALVRGAAPRTVLQLGGRPLPKELHLPDDLLEAAADAPDALDGLVRLGTLEEPPPVAASMPALGPFVEGTRKEFDAYFKAAYEVAWPEFRQRLEALPFKDPRAADEFEAAVAGFETANLDGLTESLTAAADDARPAVTLEGEAVILRARAALPAARAAIGAFTTAIEPAIDVLHSDASAIADVIERVDAARAVHTVAIDEVGIETFTALAAALQAACAGLLDDPALLADVVATYETMRAATAEAASALQATAQFAVDADMTDVIDPAAIDEVLRKLDPVDLASQKLVEQIAETLENVWEALGDAAEKVWRWLIGLFGGGGGGGGDGNGGGGGGGGERNGNRDKNKSRGGSPNTTGADKSTSAGGSKEGDDAHEEGRLPAGSDGYAGARGVVENASTDPALGEFARRIGGMLEGDVEVLPQIVRTADGGVSDLNLTVLGENARLLSLNSTDAMPLLAQLADERRFVNMTSIAFDSRETTVTFSGFDSVAGLVTVTWPAQGSNAPVRISGLAVSNAN